MKKTFIFAGVLGAALAYAQTQRVGINTSEPKATLDIAKGTGLPTGQVEGGSIPKAHTSGAERYGPNPVFTRTADF